MGTRADFYVGRGKQAEWLGSVAFDGHPDTRLPELEATDEAGYRACVEKILSSEDHATRPDQGWPWPWDDSSGSDYAYAFDGGVFVCCFGGPWVTPSEALLDEEAREALEPGPKAVFPDMSARKNVTFGRRSGLLIIGIPR